jgi:hypothetical protein
MMDPLAASAMAAYFRNPSIRADHGQPISRRSGPVTVSGREYVVLRSVTATTGSATPGGCNFSTTGHPRLTNSA